VQNEVKGSDPSSPAEEALQVLLAKRAFYLFLVGLSSLLAENKMKPYAVV